MATAPVGGERAAPTLDDVARQAGVSRATVSRALSGHSAVRPETRRSVQAAARQIGYVLNQTARSLATRHAGAVGVLIPEPDERVFTDPFFSRIFRGAMSAFAGTDTHVLLGITNSSTPGWGPSGQNPMDLLGSGRLDGAVIVSHHEAATSALAEVAAQPVPVVFVGDPQVPGAPFVDLRNREAARIATRRLIEQGRTRLAMVCGPADMHAARERRAGFLEELAAHGLEPVAQVVGDFTMQTGRRATADFLAGQPGIDGIFAASDLTAWGALQALSEAGLQVPEDVALVGFDDSPVAEAVTPALTTMTNPAETLARTAATMLRDLIDGRSPAHRQVLVSSDLVVRRSA